MLTASNLLVMRELRAMSLRKLAERAGVDKDSVLRMEQGRDVRLSTAAAVAIGLGASWTIWCPRPR